MNMTRRSFHERRPSFLALDESGESMINSTVLLTTRQLAHQLAVSESAVRKWVWLKRIPVVHVGRCIRFSLDEVLGHLRSGQHENAA
jgi:excisionase family DNA binding protein